MTMSRKASCSEIESPLEGVKRLEIIQLQSLAMPLGVVAAEIKHGHQSKVPGSDPGGSLRVKAGWAGLSPQHLRGGSRRIRS